MIFASTVDKSAPALVIQVRSFGILVGFVLGILGIDAFLVDILPNGIRGIRVVIDNTCGDKYTYELDGNKVRIAPAGDAGDSTQIVP